MNPESNLHLVSVGISVSPCEDADAIGYDERQINRIVIRIAQYFLYKDMRVIFGHDWRENGVMRAILNCAEIAAGATRAPNRGPRMLNLVPTADGPISQAASDAQRDASGILEVRSFRDYARRHGHDVPHERPSELSMLRRCLNELLNPGCRICLGGNTRPYEGRCPGVAEEAYFALEMCKPLYLIGGFGGATAAVYDALSGKTAEMLGHLDERLRKFRLDRLRNGLSPAENERLSATTDVEAAIGLISKGMNNVGLLS